MTVKLIKDLGMRYPKTSSTHKKRFGLYECFCGKRFETMVRSVMIGDTSSCGCARYTNNTKHGMRNTKLYKTWASMKSRCLNSNHKYYESYGGIGVSVCNEWIGDFMPFYDWAINNGYVEGLSIDRINNDGNYEPSNCRWATQQTQMMNTRRIHKDNTSGYRGVSYNKTNRKWCASISVDRLRTYIGGFETAFDAALARDVYIIKNDLAHTRNIV